MPERPDAESARVSQTAPDSQSVSHAVWGYLDHIPGLSSRLKRAQKDIEQGKGIKAKEYRAHR